MMATATINGHDGAELLAELRSKGFALDLKGERFSVKPFPDESLAQTIRERRDSIVAALKAEQHASDDSEPEAEPEAGAEPSDDLGGLAYAVQAQTKQITDSIDRMTWNLYRSLALNVPGDGPHIGVAQILDAMHEHQMDRQATALDIEGRMLDRLCNSIEGGLVDFHERLSRDFENSANGITSSLGDCSESLDAIGHSLGAELTAIRRSIADGNETLDAIGQELASLNRNISEGFAALVEAIKGGQPS